MGDLVTPEAFTPAALVAAIRAAGYEVELVESKQPMPTVSSAALAIGADESLILKTLIFQARTGDAVRVIASGPDRVNRTRIEELAGLGKLVMAPSKVVLEITGWPAGGVAPVGCRRPMPTFLDERVLQFERVYGGGGTEWTLIGLAPADIVAITGAKPVSLIS